MILVLAYRSHIISTKYNKNHTISSLIKVYTSFNLATPFPDRYEPLSRQVHLNPFLDLFTILEWNTPSPSRFQPDSENKTPFVSTPPPPPPPPPPPHTHTNGLFVPHPPTQDRSKTVTSISREVLNYNTSAMPIGSVDRTDAWPDENFIAKVKSLTLTFGH